MQGFYLNFNIKETVGTKDSMVNVLSTYFCFPISMKGDAILLPEGKSLATGYSKVVCREDKKCVIFFFLKVNFENPIHKTDFNLQIADNLS